MAVKKTRLTLTLDGEYRPKEFLKTLDKLKGLIEAGATAGRFDAQLATIDHDDTVNQLVAVDFKVEVERPSMRGQGGIDMRETSAGLRD